MTCPTSALHILGASADGGAETYFVDLLRVLQADGQPTAAAIKAHPERERQLREAGVRVEVMPFTRPIDFVTPHRLAALARTVEAKVLVAWMSKAASRCPKGPWRRVGRLGGYYDLKYFKGFDYLVSNTAEIRDWIIARGWPESQVRVIPNFASAYPGAAISRATFDTPEGAPLLLGMGRLHSDKAHDISLRALAELPDAYLWIAGTGPLEHQLKGLAEDLGVASRVRFLGWRNDPWALYRAADVCVFPSRIEPLGNVVIQSWAYGLPVVTAAAAGPKALVRDGIDGRLIPLEDARSLAEAVTSLLTDTSLRARVTEAGRARIEGEFSPEAVVAQWRTLYEDLAAG